MEFRVEREIKFKLRTSVCVCTRLRVRVCEEVCVCSDRVGGPTLWRARGQGPGSPSVCARAALAWCQRL